MPKVNQEVQFNAPVAKVYQAFLDAKQHGNFTGAPAEIEAKEGGRFSVYGGQVLGRTLELVPNQRIVQAWRAANWAPGVYSVLRFELSEKGGKTRLVLDHDALPDGEQEHIDAGWGKMYWEPLRKFLG